MTSPAIYGGALVATASLLGACAYVFGYPEGHHLYVRTYEIAQPLSQECFSEALSEATNLMGEPMTILPRLAGHFPEVEGAKLWARYRVDALPRDPDSGAGIDIVLSETDEGRRFVTHGFSSFGRSPQPDPRLRHAGEAMDMTEQALAAHCGVTFDRLVGQDCFGFRACSPA